MNDSVFFSLKHSLVDSAKGKYGLNKKLFSQFMKKF